MKRTYQITIKAVVEFDDEEFEVNDLDSSAVICFMEENTYDDTQLFLPKMGSMEVLEYQDSEIVELDNDDWTIK